MADRTTKLNFLFDWLKKREPFLFFLIVLLNSIPLLRSEFFLTQDGPAHLYNSVLIRDLISGNDPSVHQAFELNHAPVPNLTSHLILMLASSVFPVWIAEKIVLLLYFFGLPYAFRFFLKKSASKNPAFASLIIPITFSYFLYSGFYNFLLALLPFFIVLQLWTDPDKKISVRFGIKLFVWFTLLYFSHIYVFALAILIIGLHSLMELLLKTKPENGKNFFRSTGFLLLVLLPFLFLMTRFLLHVPIVDLRKNFSKQELARALRDFSCINRPGDFVVKFTSKIALTIFFLLICGISIRWIRFRKKAQSLFNLSDSWLLTSFILFCLYFTVPDYFGGGMNCLRIQQLMIVCTITWISLQIFSRWIYITGITAILILQCVLVSFYSTEETHSDEISEWIAAGKHIDKGTITLPVNFTENKQLLHVSGYLGASASISLIDNYEAGLLWFPVIWNNKYKFSIKGLKGRNQLIDYRNPAIVWETKPLIYADNVIIWGKPLTMEDSLSFQSLDSTIQLNYRLDYQSENLKLFKQKK